MQPVTASQASFQTRSVSPDTRTTRRQGRPGQANVVILSVRFLSTLKEGLLVHRETRNLTTQIQFPDYLD